MTDQKLWTDFVTHNMTWQPVQSKDKTEINPHRSDFGVRDTFLDALDRAKEEEKHEIKVVEQPPEPPAPVAVQEVKPPIQESPVFERKPIVQPDLQREDLQANSEDNIPKTFIYCQPAYIRERKDALYGESYKTVRYGQPFSFEGVIFNQKDLSIQVWTDSDKILEGSVLFPKIPYERRWWQVHEREQKAQGWLLSCIPSRYQPSFDNL